MNLFHHYLHFLSGSSQKSATSVQKKSTPNNREYQQSNLQFICTMQPDYESSIVMVRNKLDMPNTTWFRNKNQEVAYALHLTTYRWQITK